MKKTGRRFKSPARRNTAGKENNMISDFFEMLYRRWGLFAIHPILCLVLFLLSLLIYLFMRKCGVSAEILQICKTMTKVFGIATLCICLLLAAATVLLNIAVANM
jgi:hypothetical protein